LAATEELADDPADELVKEAAEAAGTGYGR
jgi:hypothetical protein